MANPTLITCWPFDATPENVILHPVNTLDLAPPIIIYLTRWGMMPTFPSVVNVAVGTKYGPTGAEFIGILAGGGGGLPSSSILFEAGTGERFMTINPFTGTETIFIAKVGGRNI